MQSEMVKNEKRDHSLPNEQNNVLLYVIRVSFITMLSTSSSSNDISFIHQMGIFIK